MTHRILLVETSLPVVAAVRRFLQGTEFEVHVAPPAEGPETVDATACAVALLRPGGDGGREALERLRATAPSLPVLLLVDEEEDPVARDAPDGVLAAPLSRSALLSLLRVHVRLRAEAERAGRLERELAERPASLPDYEFLKRLLLVEVKRSRRYRYPASLALVAIDGWKEHAARLDEAARSALLGEVLALVTRGVRDIDLPLVFDEERLLVFMPHTDALGARTVAARLVRRARAHPIGLTVSAGVATYRGEGTLSLAGLVRAATDALHEAQAAGGDRPAQGEVPEAMSPA
ncbi:MAG TPA: diguanylate cyclase [Anaeromyxobacteraceae bacterium]|nr:diguanylate cyclase [Anaeromyxobacteraceae bacterium]